MPTYTACGMTARLATCELKGTLSSCLDLRMGGEQRKDAARIQKALSRSEKLDERIVGPDGSESGVVQFIGVHQDMPLLVVEAGEQLRKDNATKKAAAPKPLQKKDRSSIGLQSSSDSPLTSLSATPTPTHEAFQDVATGSTAAKPQRKWKPTAKAAAAKSKMQSTSSTEQHTLEEALQNPTMYGSNEQRALVLDIEMDHGTFLPAKGSASLGKDLKIEIFVNGDLADISFVNARRSAVQIIGDQIRFSGTRMHRQTEKPWVYSPDEDQEQKGDAAKRWLAVSKALSQHARERGTDRYGGLQPSADFLSALAATPLPERLKAIRSIGFIDVLVTAGKGQKYGPDTAYLTRAMPMNDPDFNTSNLAVDPFWTSNPDVTSLFGGGAVSSPLKHLSFTQREPFKSLPEVPLRAMTQPPSLPFSPTPKKKNESNDLAKEFGLTVSIEDTKSILTGGFENSRGRPVAAGRTLFTRLVDLQKMNDKNQKRYLETLKQEVPGVFSTNAREPSDEVVERPLKRLRTDSDTNCVDPRSIMANPLATDRHVQEDDVFGTTNPQAVLTQNRVDMALNSGAASNGALLRQIASSSPVKTPRKTQASALAYSPIRITIKEQKTGGRGKSRQQTPQKPSATIATIDLDNIDPVLFSTPKPSRADTAANNISPSKSGRGANRSAKKWDPREMSSEDALRAFEIPQLCKGSAVTFPADNTAMRQIGKARGGIFKEEGVVVGMRFVVW